eukprot:GFUD01031072.1.p1 GENE.GFUD01031072.1~~GFUD01031072.1.p1  ORF type:complete len:164 (+),score=57.28 GFUD01031072.1:51-494(+)
MEPVKEQIEPEDLRARFDQIDKNGDGYLSVSELESLLGVFGVVDCSMVDNIITKWDKEGNGKLCFEEFMTMITSAQSIQEEEQGLKKAFEVFNKNGDGFITWQELKDGLSLIDRVSDADVSKMMGEADTNKDEKIDLMEFMEMMRKQ